jgi:hypothetical protein
VLFLNPKITKTLTMGSVADPDPFHFAGSENFPLHHEVHLQSTATLTKYTTVKPGRYIYTYELLYSALTARDTANTIEAQPHLLGTPMYMYTYEAKLRLYYDVQLHLIRTHDKYERRRYENTTPAQHR